VKDIITNITPKETPFINSIGKTKATSTIHSWLTDDDPDPTTDGAVEGADPTDNNLDAPDRLSNYTQIIEDTFKITGSLEAVDTIGRKNDKKYRLMKSLRLVAKKIEKSAINRATSNAGTAGTARLMMGMEGFITTNDDSYAASTAFDSDKFLTMAQHCYDAGGNPNILLVTSGVKKAIGSWDQGNRITVNADQEDKKLVMAVAVLETPFGIVRVLLSRLIDISGGATTAYLIESDMWKLSTLRSTKTSPLAKTGDASRYQTLWEGTLESLSEQASSKCGNCAA